MKAKALFSTLVAASWLFVSPAGTQAQTTKPSDEATLYFSDVRGWDVYYIHSSEWGPQGCRAMKKGPAGEIILNDRIVDRTAEGAWELIVPTDQTSRYEGGILSVDKIDFEVQFGIENGWATRELTDGEFEQMKAGDQLVVEITGDPARTWSLAGFTAASLKVYECMTQGGIPPKKGTTPDVAMPSPANSPFLYSPPSNGGAPGSEIESPGIGDCKLGFSDWYRCLFTHFVPGKGEKSVVRIDDAFDEQPSLYLHVKSGSDIEVSYADDENGPWATLGVWEIYDKKGKCIRPKAGQSGMAKQNLGQDNWELCLN